MVYERDINKSISSIYQSLGLYSLPSHVSPLNKKKNYPAFLPNRKLSSLLAFTCCIALYIKMLTPSQIMFKTPDMGLRVNLNDHIHELN